MANKLKAEPIYAFPRSNAGFIIPENISGMTLRQWYAGQALAGIMANHYSMENIAVEKAFALADAMIQFEQNG